MAQPTAHDQYLIELINKIRSNPTAASQQYRGSLGNNTATPKEPLAISLKLTDAAQSHSQDMLSRGYFSHTGSGGSSAIQRIEDTGFPLQTFRTPQNQLWSYGENISAKPLTDINNPNPNVTPQDVENHIYWDGVGGGWWPSSGHRDTILREGYKEIGVGVANGPYSRYSNKSYTIATANFGTQDLDGAYDTQHLDQAFLTGVAFDDKVTDDDFYTPGEGLGGIKIEAVRQSDQQSFTTRTFGSGGYSLSLEPGTYQVSFSEGGLPKAVTETVIIGTQNVKLDLDTDERGIVTGPTPTPSPNPTPTPSPTPTDSGIGPDFNDDGNTDILQQDKSANQIEAWLMNGTERQSVREIATLPQNFEVRAIGDFNGDDQEDLILQGPRGKVESWFLNGTQRSSSETIFEYLFDTNQQVEGAADFDGDGHDDLLIRNPVTGENEIWAMNGTDWLADLALPSRQGQNWQIVGTGDFNDDKNTDILWRNSSTGQNQVWYLKGHSRTGTANLPSLQDPNQVGIGVGDYNNDGKPDVIWSNQATGEHSVWLMDGVQRIRSQVLSGIPNQGGNPNSDDGQTKGIKRTGDSSNNVLKGGIGNDHLIGNNGDDHLTGDAGNDRLFGNNGNDRLIGNSGNDIMKGGDGQDKLNGGNGRDKLFGEQQRDILNGGAGNDLIMGGLGKDVLTGGADRDQFRFTSVQDFGDRITDFEIGNDKIDLRRVQGISSMDDLKFSQRGDKAIIQAEIGDTFRTLAVLNDIDINDITQQHFML